VKTTSVYNKILYFRLDISFKLPIVNRHIFSNVKIIYCVIVDRLIGTNFIRSLSVAEIHCKYVVLVQTKIITTNNNK